MSSRALRPALVAMPLAAVFLAPPPPVLAHDIPSDVTVQVFVKPEGHRLRLVVRAPLAAMRDVDYRTRGPGYLDLGSSEPALSMAAKLWIADAIELFEADAPLPQPTLVAVRVALPSDRSFGSYEEALVHVTGPALPPETELYWAQGMLDALFECEIRSDASRFSLEQGFARLGQRVTTVVRYLPPGGTARAFELVGDPGLVRLDPSLLQAAARFVKLGFLHILEGTDHLLFLFCLVVPFRQVRALFLIVTSFTLAHSLTLIATALRLSPEALWFPPLVETLIALSIVFMALENIVVAQPRRRWLMAFGFGLVHGFGFAFALRETLQFAGSHLITSLFSFNLGVELGQLAVLLLLVPTLGGLFRLVVAQRAVAVVLSALVAHTGWHWMLERFARLRQFRFQWPVWDAGFLAAATWWLMLAVSAAGLAWLVSVVILRPWVRQSGTLFGDESHEA